MWSWKLEARDKIGTLRRGRVRVARVLTKLGAFIDCVGATGDRVDPTWLDRIESPCRQMTVEILP